MNRAPLPLLLRLLNQTPERILASIAALSHGVVGYSHGGPVAVPDVSAYLAVAQWLFGGELPNPLGFSPGYGMLLAPFGLLRGADLHTAALLINGIAAGGCILAAAMLTRAMGGSNRTALCAAAIAAIHPSLTAASRIAWPETVLTLLLLTIAILSYKDRWFVAGVLAGISTCLHLRSVVIVVALILTAMLLLRCKSALLGVALGGSVSLLTMGATNTWPSQRLTAAQNVASPDQLVAVITGQWLALAIGTGGLGILGISIGLRRVIRRDVNSAAFLLSLSAIGMLFLGGWVLAGSDRVDVLLYSRYIGPWAVPLTVLGVVNIANRTVQRSEVRKVAAMTAISLIVGLVAQSGLNSQPRRIMTLDTSFLWKLLDERLIFVLVAGSLLVLGSVATARRGLLVPLTVAVLIAVPSTFINHHHLHEVGVIADAQSTATKFVPSSTMCLAHDATAKNYALWLYRLELPNMKHRRVDLLSGGEPCSAYVIASKSGIENCHDAKMLAAEPRAVWGLWQYPGKDCD